MAALALQPGRYRKRQISFSEIRDFVWKKYRSASSRDDHARPKPWSMVTGRAGTGHTIGRRPGRDHQHIAISVRAIKRAVAARRSPVVSCTTAPRAAPKVHTSLRLAPE